jgi:5-methylcytosine-specific restriction endonuclease McrBC regulatory subunit McrC
VASKSIKLIRPQPATYFELQDNSIEKKSAIKFFQLKSRDPLFAAAQLAEQFEKQNRQWLTILDVKLEREFDGRDVALHFYSGNSIGAVPLLSPTRATPDYGLVVKPRFSWSGIGSMLSQMGWRIVPTPLKLPLLKTSERQVPPWILSSMILVRLKGLLDSLTRRFEMVSEDRNAPRGAVRWQEYATTKIARGNLSSVPCVFQDLRDDRTLKGAIRHVLQKHLRALESQRGHGTFVHHLIALCEKLLQRVQNVASHVPTPTVLLSWQKRPLQIEKYNEGIQAIEWTLQDRGLAGTSDLEGLPWVMPMEEFFEAWVETVFQSVARRMGARFKVGRLKQTTHPINWDTPYWGSQKTLVPDIWVEWNSTTLIVDAKYKRHWEEMQLQPWMKADQILKEQHRNDLLQVLAYASLAQTQQVIACLTYPCSINTWNKLNESGRLIQRAEVGLAQKSLQLWLTAIPMDSTVEKVSAPLLRSLIPVLQEQ